MAEYRYRDDHRDRGYRDHDERGRHRDDPRSRDDDRGIVSLGRDRDGRDRDGRDGPGQGSRYREDDRERGYGSDDRNRGLPMDETSHLIASNKVEGTAVYGHDGRRLGSIHNFMVDKLTGKVEYAVMSYGSGFLGMGTRYYPLPWRVLSYDTRAGGYRIDMTERDLRDAPSFDRESEPRFDHRYGSRVHDYYGLKY
jgi:sporulation protein YlmC with PRC-barrel domain